jgi:thiamine pyrophosphokinase
MNSVLIICNSELPKKEVVGKLLKEVDYIVCACGGANRALEYDIIPDAVVGDLDSISEETKRKLDKKIFHQILDFNSTDLEKTMRFIYEKGLKEAIIIGGTSGKFDYALGNLSILKRWGDKIDLKIVDDYSEIKYINKKISFEGEIGTVISLIAVGKAEGINTEGLKYNLKNFDMEFSDLGIHNEIISNPVTISVERGDLFIFKGNYIEFHKDEDELKRLQL